MSIGFDGISFRFLDRTAIGDEGESVKNDGDRNERHSKSATARGCGSAWRGVAWRGVAWRGARCSSWFAFKLASRSAGARDPAAREESHVSVTSLRLYREQAACEYAGARETSVLSSRALTLWLSDLLGILHAGRVQKFDVAAQAPRVLAGRTFF